MKPEIWPFPFEPGKVLIDGRFLVKEELGQGGMGRCYRVWQASLERTCVLKMLAPKLHPRFLPHRDARVLLENEAKTLGVVADGNDSFVQVFDRGRVNVSIRMNGEPVELDLPYYVMEYIRGHSLHAIIAGCRERGVLLPITALLKLAIQLSRALAIAHSRGVIHRDIKPDNIIMQQRPEGPPVVKYIDFGVSTREGAPGVLGTGTTRYGAPELLSLRVGPESTQSDMYPLGLVVYELAALRGPFVFDLKEDYVHAHIYERAPDIRQFRDDVPVPLAELLAAVLAKDPKERPTAKQFADALELILTATEKADGSAQPIADFIRTLGVRAARDDARTRSRSGSDLHGRGNTTSPGSAKRALIESRLYERRPREKTLPLGAGRPAARDTLRMGLPGPGSPVSPPPVEAHPVIRLAADAGAVTDPVLVTAAHDTVPDAPAFKDEPGASRPAAGIEDVPDVPVYQSMAQLFDAVWDDDDRYQASPFEEAQPELSWPKAPIAEPRPEATSDGAVVVRGRDSTEKPRGRTGLASAAVRRGPYTAMAASFALAVAISVTAITFFATEHAATTRSTISGDPRGVAAAAGAPDTPSALGANATLPVPARVEPSPGVTAEVSAPAPDRGDLAAPVPAATDAGVAGEGTSQPAIPPPLRARLAAPQHAASSARVDAGPAPSASPYSRWLVQDLKGADGGDDFRSTF